MRSAHDAHMHRCRQGMQSTVRACCVSKHTTHGPLLDESTGTVSVIPLPGTPPGTLGTSVNKAFDGAVGTTIGVATGAVAIDMETGVVLIVCNSTRGLEVGDEMPGDVSAFRLSPCVTGGGVKAFAVDNTLTVVLAATSVHCFSLVPALAQVLKVPLPSLVVLQLLYHNRWIAIPQEERVLDPYPTSFVRQWLPLSWLGQHTLSPPL